MLSSLTAMYHIVYDILDNYRRRNTMQTEVMEKCDMLVENRNIIYKGFMLEDSLMQVLAAMSFVDRGEIADVKAIKRCRKILRKKHSAFSYLRGNNELFISSKMALSDDPEKYLDDITETYEKLQVGKFFGSTYRVLSALIICDAGKADESDKIIEKTEELLNGMKEAHPFLTNDEDTCLAVLLAMTEKSSKDILSELESTYLEIKNEFMLYKNSAYSLCQVLTTLDGAYKRKCEKTIALFDSFKEAGTKYGKEYELASLGLLTNIQMDVKDIVAEVIGTAEYLKNKKGFNFWYMTKQTRLMFAAMLVSESYTGDSATSEASVASSTVARVIAQQAAMFVVLVSSSAASITTSTSSN